MGTDWPLMAIMRVSKNAPDNIATCQADRGTTASLPSKDLCRERRENNEKHDQHRYVASVVPPSVAIPDSLKEANSICERQYLGHGLKSRR